MRYLTFLFTCPTHIDVTTNKTQAETTLQTTYTRYISKHKLQKVLLKKHTPIFG